MDRGDDLRYRFKRTEYLPRREAPARTHAVSNSLGEFTSAASQPKAALLAVADPVPVVHPVVLQANDSTQAIPIPMPVQASEPVNPPAAEPQAVYPTVVPTADATPRPTPKPTSNEFVPVRSRPFLTTQPVQQQTQPTAEAVQPAYDYSPKATEEPAEAVLPVQSHDESVEDQAAFEALKMDQEPTALPASFQQHAQLALEPHKIPRKHRTKKKKLLLATPLAVLVIAGTGYFAFAHMSHPARPPQTLAAEVVIETEEVPVNTAALKKNQAQVKYPLYYPKTLPKGYTVDDTSYNITSGLFNFKIRSPKGQLIPVVEQLLLPGFKLPGADNAVTVNIGPQNFSTEAGIANIIASNEKVIGMLTTAKTVVILNLSGLPGVDCDPIMRGFTLYQAPTTSR